MLSTLCTIYLWVAFITIIGRFEPNKLTNTILWPLKALGGALDHFFKKVDELTGWVWRQIRRSNA
jgi:hypothetical protein